MLIKQTAVSLEFAVSLMLISIGIANAGGLSSNSDDESGRVYNNVISNVNLISEFNEKLSVLESYAFDNAQVSALEFENSNRDHFEIIKMKRIYVAGFSVMLFGSNSGFGQNARGFLGKASVGFCRPYYNFKHDMRVVGVFDLRLDANIIGLRTELLLGFNYDLQKDLNKKPPKILLDMTYYGFKLYLPFGHAAHD